MSKDSDNPNEIVRSLEGIALEVCALGLRHTPPELLQVLFDALMTAKHAAIMGFLVEEEQEHLASVARSIQTVFMQEIDRCYYLVSDRYILDLRDSDLEELKRLREAAGRLVAFLQGHRYAQSASARAADDAMLSVTHRAVRETEERVRARQAFLEFLGDIERIESWLRVAIESRCKLGDLCLDRILAFFTCPDTPNSYIEIRTYRALLESEPGFDYVKEVEEPLVRVLALVREYLRMLIVVSKS